MKSDWSLKLLPLIQSKLCTLYTTSDYFRYTKATSGKIIWVNNESYAVQNNKVASIPLHSFHTKSVMKTDFKPINKQ